MTGALKIFMGKKPSVSGEMMEKRKAPNPLRHSLTTFAVAIVVMLIFAYGFQVTKVDLETPKTPRRQMQLTNILRGLAQPHLFDYDEERIAVDAPVLMPCITGAVLPETNKSSRYIEVTPNCADLGAKVAVTGSNFKPGESIYLYFVPEAAKIEDQIELPLAPAVIKADEQGHFSYQAKMKNDRPSDRPQIVRAMVRTFSGWPRPSDTLIDTFAKIIETIFLALIATTLGTLLAIPISFIAARNLMNNVLSPFGSIMTALLAAPLGWAAGSLALGWLEQSARNFTGNSLLGFILLLLAAGSAGLLVRLLSQQRGKPLSSAIRWALILLIAVLAIVAIGLLERLGLDVGAWLRSNLGAAGFLGNFLFIVADFVTVTMPLIGSFGGLFIFTSLASRYSERLLHSANPVFGRGYSVIVAALAGGLLTFLSVWGITWLYEIDDLFRVALLPTVIAAAGMGIMGFVSGSEKPFPIGSIIYNITRTILNALRSIEPLIMVVAFAVWVGIGPFAGVIALALHTIAGLGKLYSEQVENILPEPIEALTATGANRLQTIIYAIIPQIVPPYISFTIYRWDINVRMSTIIGFGGGGGIGFLVQQNLNLLKYRDASVQMIAIAVVVAALDYMSARVRERIV
jgi:phosphonate ABC transporter permease subunit PhnE